MKPLQNLLAVRVSAFAMLAIMFASVAVVEFVAYVDILNRVNGVERPVLLGLTFLVAGYWGWILLIPVMYAAAVRFPILLLGNAVLVHIPLGLIVSALSIVVATYSLDLVDWSGLNLVPSVGGRLRSFFPIAFVYYLMFAFAIAVVRYQSALSKASLEKAELHADQAELRAKLTQMRLDSLHSQLQPHFLFNAMHTLTILIDKDTTQAKQAIKRLSALLRSALRSSQTSSHTLRSEVEWIEDFLAFERLRFERDVRLTCEIDPALTDLQVPNMLLQPLFENALKHGARDDEALELRFSARRLPTGQVELCIQDNGSGLGEAPIKRGDGLRLVEERLSTRSQDFALVLGNADPQGAQVRLVWYPSSQVH